MFDVGWMDGFSVVMVERPVVLFSVRACFFCFLGRVLIYSGAVGRGWTFLEQDDTLCMLE